MHYRYNYMQNEYLTVWPKKIKPLQHNLLQRFIFYLIWKSETRKNYWLKITALFFRDKNPHKNVNKQPDASKQKNNKDYPGNNRIDFEILS